MDDMLTTMMKMQHDFQTMVNGYSVEDQSSDQRIENFKITVLALTDELHEALAEMGWKPWATSRHFNTDAVRGELIDAWHFMMNLFLHAGMTAEDVFKAYASKMATNIARQRAGYDGVSTKCPVCKRAYDDSAVRCRTMTTKEHGWCAMYHRVVEDWEFEGPETDR